MHLHFIMINHAKFSKYAKFLKSLLLRQGDWRPQTS